MTRARVEKAAHVAVRRFAGIRSSITFDRRGAKRPRASAWPSRAASTVMKTSAGPFAPSLLMRSRSSSSFPSIRATRIPVFAVNRAYNASSVW